MIAKTERLHIERATLADGPFFLKLMNSANWLAFIGDRGINSENEARDYIQKNLLDRYSANGYALYKISLEKTGEAIGICGFIKREYLEHADIGFAMLPEFEGKGYAFEAAKAVLKYGAKNLQLHPILAVTTKENIKSVKLLKKIGLRKIDTIQPSGSKVEFLLFSNTGL